MLYYVHHLLFIYGGTYDICTLPPPPPALNHQQRVNYDVCQSCLFALSVLKSHWILASIFEKEPRIRLTKVLDFPQHYIYYHVVIQPADSVRGPKKMPQQYLSVTYFVPSMKA